MSESRATLSQRQIQFLRWLDENPSTSARWLVDGKPIKRDPPERWNVWEISGPHGSIRISAEDQLAVRGFVIGCPTPDKLYGLTKAGREAIAETASPS